MHVPLATGLPRSWTGSRHGDPAHLSLRPVVAALPDGAERGQQILTPVPGDWDTFRLNADVFPSIPNVDWLELRDAAQTARQAVARPPPAGSDEAEPGPGAPRPPGWGTRAENRAAPGPRPTAASPPQMELAD